MDDLSMLKLPDRRDGSAPRGLTSMARSTVNLNYEPALSHSHSRDSGLASELAEAPESGGVKVSSSTDQEYSRPPKSPSVRSVASIASVNSVGSHNSQKSTSSRDEEGPALVNQKVAQFIHSLQQPKYDTPLSGTDISQLFQTFYVSLEQALNPHEDVTNQPMLSREEISARRAVRNVRRKQLPRLLDAAEVQLTGVLYSKLIDPVNGPDRALDSRIQARLAALQEHPQLAQELELELEPSVAAKLSATADILKSLDTERAPVAKLDVLLRTHRELVSVLDAAHAGADGILPAFVQTLIISNPAHLWNNFVYMRRFRRQNALIGEHSYCLTNLEAALQLLSTAQFKNIPADCDPSIFAPEPQLGLTSRLPSFTKGGLAAIGSTISSMSTGYRALVARFQREDYTLADVRKELGIDPPTPIRSRTASQSSLASVWTLPKLGGAPAPNQRLLTMDADSLTISDVRDLLAEYKKLAAWAFKDARSTG